jgi:hypothetical protein
VGRLATPGATTTFDGTTPGGALTFSLFGTVSGLMSAVWLLSACSNAAVSRAIGTTDGKSAIVVNRSESAVIVENRVGRPLLNVRVTVEVETGPPFVLVLPTMDTGEKRDLRFEELRTEDGALLDPVSIRPRQVKVTARDTLTNSYEVMIPWEG